MANAVADIFLQAAALNRDDPRRVGNVIVLGEGLDVLVTGDIHGNRKALTRIISYANLAGNDARRLILQEILHGGDDDRTGHDRSIELLLRAVRLKIAHPKKVIFLMGNHDLAQATDKEITKDGRGSCKSFNDGVRAAFGENGDEILEAIDEFCLSMPLAVRCANRVMIAHSLPSPQAAERFDVEVLNRPYGREDLLRGGSVYEWTWGRGQTDEQTDRLAETLDVDFFVLGHKHVEMGCEAITSRAVALASNHEQGCLMQFSTDRPLDADNVESHIKRIVAMKP